MLDNMSLKRHNFSNTELKIDKIDKIKVLLISCEITSKDKNKMLGLLCINQFQALPPPPPGQPWGKFLKFCNSQPIGKIVSQMPSLGFPETFY